jgi:hypothetical protein
VFVLYDAKGNLLEAKSAITNLSSSAITDYNNQFTIAKISNAAYADVAYTSFEANGNGNWTIPTATAAIDSSTAITGRKSFNVGYGVITKGGLNPATTYMVSLWAKVGTSVNIYGYNTAPIATHNGWSFYTQEVTGTADIYVSGNGLIDELRLHPKDANMTTSTYEQMVGITSTADANNNITYYEYDTLNRVNLIRDRDRNIVKKYQYAKDVPARIIYPPHWVPYVAYYNTLLGITTAVNWRTDCSSDSVYYDDNPQSDSFSVLKRIPLGVNICICPYINNFPSMYRTVNGVCEVGLRTNVSTVRVKQISATNVVTYVWICTWHYTWSDGSIGVDYTETNADPCYIGTPNPI